MKRIGILGGGQLGKMLIQSASRFALPCIVVEPSAHAPAVHYAHRHIEGHFNDEQAVRRLQGLADVVTVEIEHVSLKGLEALQQNDITIHPNIETLAVIKDKALQKQFLSEKLYPTSPFRVYEHYHELVNALNSGKEKTPLVQKAATDGYDGRGVQVLRSEEDIDKVLACRSVAEDMIDIHYEMSVIAARNASGQVEVFPPVTMDFHPEANQVELVHFHNDLPDHIRREATSLAAQLIEDFGMCGLLAVEMFVDRSEKIWVNEVAPRPHNSGHLTMEGFTVSQYEQHIRAILNWPLIKPEPRGLTTMINIVGEPGHAGPAYYEGLEEVLKVPGAYIHIYGKAETRPFRKMGHINVVDNNRDVVMNKVKFCQNTIRCISKLR